MGSSPGVDGSLSPVLPPPNPVLALHPSPALGWAAVEGCANLTEVVDDWVWEKAGGLRGLDSSLPSSGKGTSQSRVRDTVEASFGFGPMPGTL